MSTDSLKSPTPPNDIPTSSANTMNNDQTAADTSDRRSPPPSCPICLGSYKNKCFTDSCLHQFCFNCLLEWSKIKAECPLCKQSFKSIIHNVKSEREFEEYLVQQPLHYNLMLSEPFRFSYSTTLNVRPSQNEALQRLFLHHPSLSDRYVYPRSAETPNVRRRIYDRGLYALPLFDITGRARECSAEFYRTNQAQIHRLIPFLNREAIHIIQDPRRVSSLLQRANEILTTCDINSQAFRRAVEPYFQEHTVHFIHEFYNFARSPYDLYGYDNNVQYSQDYNLALQSNDSGLRSGDSNSGTGGDNADRSTRTNAVGAASSSSSSRRLVGSQTAAATSSVLWPSTNAASAFSQVINVISSSSSSSSSTPSSDDTSDNEKDVVRGPSSSGNRESASVIQAAPGTSSSSAVVATDTTAGRGDVAIKTEQRVESVIRTTTTTQEPVKIELSDTDSDECQFVLERKPPHLRTPEYVSLNSDEDSDVVFVDNRGDNLNPEGVRGQQPEALQQGSGQVQRPAIPMPIQEPPSSHMPSFMPFMLGMDEVEGNDGEEEEPKPGPSNAVSEAHKWMAKSEDPMMSVTASPGASPSKKRSSHRTTRGPKRKRKSNHRQHMAGKRKSHQKNSGSSDEEDDDRTQMNVRSTSRKTGVAVATATTTEESTDSESSHDEYAVSQSPRKMSTRKMDAIRVALTTKTLGRTRKRRAQRKPVVKEFRASDDRNCSTHESETDVEAPTDAMVPTNTERSSDMMAETGPHDEAPYEEDNDEIDMG